MESIAAICNYRMTNVVIHPERGAGHARKRYHPYGVLHGDRGIAGLCRNLSGLSRSGAGELAWQCLPPEPAISHLGSVEGRARANLSLEAVRFSYAAGA